MQATLGNLSVNAFIGDFKNNKHNITPPLLWIIGVLTPGFLRDI